MISKRASAFVRGSQAFLALGMVIIMLVPCVRITGTSGVSQAKSTLPSVSQEATIANNIDCLSRLNDSDWFSLSFEEKLDVLQAVANIECRYLGISHELNVVAKDMEQGTILGSYSDRTHTISVMLTERDEFIYDEMITHVPMSVHKNAKDILVIGAGDGGVVRELTRYDRVERDRKSVV